MNISISQQIEEVQRELALRASVYPRMISSGKMRESGAAFHIERMKAVLTTLEWLQKNEALIRGKAA